ncbi:MAG: hypothetical protein ABSH42_13920 [Bryobacteraceae bacterium]|jgi:hypothetical protein
MSTAIRNGIRREVLKYVKGREPVSMGIMADDLRKVASLRGLPDSDFRSVVQPMIATGKLDYAPGLKIKLGNTNA